MCSRKSPTGDGTGPPSSRLESAARGIENPTVSSGEGRHATATIGPANAAASTASPASVRIVAA